MCNKKEYANPFSQESEIYAKKMDDAVIKANHVQREKLLNKIETAITNVDDTSQA